MALDGATGSLLCMALSLLGALCFSAGICSTRLN